MLIDKTKDSYDIIVVGGGHAGVEAACAASAMGMSTLLLCLNFAMVSNMPCNPSIGGSAKGIVVREIDALGGIMGKMADMKGSLLQMKVLNTSKGPGVRCLRAQEDKRGYPRNVQNYLLTIPGLDILEAECTGILTEQGHASGISLSDGRHIFSKAVVLSTGTHMESVILRGHIVKEEGPDGERASHGLSSSLRSLGISLLRLKTGTPPRLDPATIDYSGMEIELGTPGRHAFSYDTTEFMDVKDMVSCHLCYTNERTHQIIRDHLQESAMYGGVVKGVGPRYCPSIEDKIVRFKDKPRHQLFLEPESLEFESIYLQGFSTSMPERVQEEMVHSLKGLEKARFLKYAYAIEYDAVDPLQLDHTLMVRSVPGLYVCGQIACTSGYEEAAALGLMAGINASLRIKGEESLVLKREEAYIGIMIDDLVTKGTKEPYRLLSSRSEFRLLTRSDNADERLIEHGRRVGLLSLERYQRLKKRLERIEEGKALLRSRHIGNDARVRDYLTGLGFPQPNGADSLEDVLRRQKVTYAGLADALGDLPYLDAEEQFKLETDVKYEGYIKAQIRLANIRKEMEGLTLPDDLDYLRMDGLSLESREKLDRLRPKTLGEASRIQNVHPSDIDVLSFYVRHKKNG